MGKFEHPRGKAGGGWREAEGGKGEERKREQGGSQAIGARERRCECVTN
jgi:hypothetical protein